MNGGRVWIRSTYSDGQGGNCVEWAPERTFAADADADADADRVVPVRDSKDPSRTLHFPVGAWAAFIAEVRGRG